MSLREASRQALLLARKDLQATFRSGAGLVALVAAPLIMMMLLGYVFPNVGSIQGIAFAVANEDAEADDPASPSRAFLERFLAENERAGSFEIHRYATEEAAREALRSRDVRGVLVIPENFSANARHGGVVNQVLILYDQSNPSLGRLVGGEASRMVAALGSAEAQENVRDATRYGSEEAVRAFIQPYAAEVRGATSVAPSYFQFLAPGLMTLMAVGAVMSGLPASFNTEKTRGTLDSLLVAPIGRWTLIAGKVMAQLARGLFQAGMLFLLAILLFGVKLAGSLGLAALLLLLTVLSFVGIGVLLTALQANDEAGSLGIMIYLPTLLLSGVVFPVEQLPLALQWISKAIPLTYAVTAMRKVMILDAGLAEVLPELLVLLAFGAASFAFAGRYFNRAFTR